MSDDDAELGGLKVRDRTSEFFERRKAQRSSASTAGASGFASNGVAAQTSAPILPPWVRSLEQFFDLEAKVKVRQEKLIDSQRAFLRPRFGPDEAEHEMHAGMEKQADEIQKLLRELERMVLTGMRPGDMANEEEVRIAHNAQRCLSTELKKTIQSFKRAQEFFGGQLKRQEMKAKKFMNIVDDDQSVELVAREEKAAQFLELGYTEGDIEGLLLEDAQQQETNREIKEILTSIQELHAMFEDLSILVADQGTMLDRIDFNIQQASQHVSKGLGELKKAQEHQGTCAVM